MSEIFISYKSEEKAVARQLAAALESEDRSVWWDRELVTGEDIDLVIERAMKEARCVIVIWSKRAVQSGYVMDEARFAQKNKKLFPVKIEPVDLPFRFDNLHTHDLAGWDGSASHALFKELASDIRKYCDGNGAVSGTETETEAGTDSGFEWSKWKRPLAVALAILLLVPLSWLIAKHLMERKKALTPDQEVALLVEERRYKEMGAQFPEQDREARAAGGPDMIWHNPAETFQDCEQCPKMVVVPRGHFRMGSVAGEDNEKPVHVVAIHHRLAVGVYEVTRDQFEAFVNAKPEIFIEDACLVESEGELITRSDRNWREPGFEQDGAHPVVCVSWNHAVAYTDWLNSLVDPMGKPYRLPSEAEWEYAARSSRATRYWWGDELEPNKANCESCGNPWDNTGTIRVGSFPSNIFSIADTAGNVGEWVQDCWNDTYENAPVDGAPWARGDCTYRGVRGGRWSTNRKSIRSAARNRFLQGKQVNSVGFRVVRSLP